MGWRGSRYEIIPDKNHTGRMVLSAGPHSNSNSNSHNGGTQHMPALNLRLGEQLITEETYTDSIRGGHTDRDRDGDGIPYHTSHITLNTAESPHTHSINGMASRAMMNSTDNPHMRGTLLAGFTKMDSYCGLDGCYRLTVTANTSESVEVSRVHAATSFFEACGYRGSSLCVCVCVFVCLCVCVFYCMCARVTACERESVCVSHCSCVSVRVCV
jgi:hypothetical protein